MTTTTVVQTRRLRPGRRLIKFSAALILLLSAWVAYDLYSSSRTSLRDFDADPKVGSKS